ncbi:MAG: FAD-dependent oxidoreductase [Candidatus Pacebacteria bacterium]|nr:FAD-dependent oxidoreductase [Candidatus Paceibacterota bacterium]
MNGSNYELIIVGGGPAGAAAAIYAARKRLKTLFITNEWGGQSTVSTDIQNWIGTPSISGADLAKNLKAHVEAQANECLTILSPALASSLEPKEDSVEVTTNKGVFSAKSLLITTGAQRRKLDVPGAETYDQKGLTYCASCDGPLFADKDVVVVGGGNAAFETALQLLAYCKTVTLLNRTETFKADEVTVASVAAHANMRIVKNAIPIEVVGTQFVTGIKYKDATNGQETLLPVEGVFVEIGLLPNTDWIGDKLKMNPIKQIKIDPRTQRTMNPMIWAAGDCTDGLYHQNNIAAGDAVKALEDIYMALHRN